MSGAANLATPRRLADLGGPKGGPVLGNAPQIEPSRLHLIVEAWARVHGPMYRLRVGPTQVLVVSDPLVVHQMLRDRPDAIRRSSRMARVLNELGVVGVFTAEGEEWRQQRKLAMRALTPEVIRRFFPTMQLMTRRLLHRWQAALAHGQTIAVQRDLKAYALDLTVGLAMGQDINALEDTGSPLQRDIESMFEKASRRLTAPLPYWRLFKLPSDRAADAAADRIGKAVGGFVEQARAALEQDPQRRLKPANLMEALVAARDEPGSGFDDEDVIGNAVTVVLAGEDTTANTTAWLLDSVCRQPGVATRLAEETRAVVGNAEVLPDFAALNQLPYTDAAIQEALRLKPAFPLLTLESNCDQNIGGVMVPAGTLILAVLRQVEPGSRFDPERWLSPQESDVHAGDDQSRRLLAFGAGPRLCPGRFLALAEIKMIMSMVTANFDISLDDTAASVDEIFSLSMMPSALPLRLRPRRHSSRLGQGDDLVAQPA